MNFRQVIEKYGYPFISKEVSETVDYARRYVKALEAWKKENEPQPSSSSDSASGPSPYSSAHFLLSGYRNIQAPSVIARFYLILSEKIIQALKQYLLIRGLNIQALEILHYQKKICWFLNPRKGFASDISLIMYVCSLPFIHPFPRWSKAFKRRKNKNYPNDEIKWRTFRS